MTGDFIVYSNTKHQSASGSQNAQLQIDSLLVVSNSSSVAQAAAASSGSVAKTATAPSSSVVQAADASSSSVVGTAAASQRPQPHVQNSLNPTTWQSSALSSGGKHSEKQLLDEYVSWFDGNIRFLKTKLVVTKVQLISRFNPCPECAELLVAFKRSLEDLCECRGQTVFETGDRGYLWHPDENNTLHGKQINADAAQIQKHESIAKLITAGWTWVGNIESVNSKYHKDLYRTQASAAAKMINGYLFDQGIFAQVNYDWDAYVGSYREWLRDRISTVEHNLSSAQKTNIWESYPGN